MAKTSRRGRNKVALVGALLLSVFLVAGGVRTPFPSPSSSASPASPALAAAPAPPQLLTVPDPPSCDLGRLEQGQIGVWGFQVKNAGGGLLEWRAWSDRTWLLLEPQSGSLEAEKTAWVRVTVDTGGLPPGRHQGRIILDSNGGRRVGLIALEVLPGDGLADSPWPAFQRDPQRTGRSPLRGPERPEARWSYEASGPIWSSPAIGPDGTIYFTSVDGWLYALTPEGHERWRLKLGEIILASPAIGRDGTIYVGDNHYLYAITPEGTIRWAVEVGDLVTSSPIIGGDGTIYVGGEGLFAVSPEGTIRWVYRTEGYVDNSAPALGEDGAIYVGFSTAVPGGTSRLVALNPGGTERWGFQVPAPIPSTPTVGPDGTVYFLSKEGRLYALSRSGRLRWKRYITVFPQTAFLPSPAIGQDGTVYVGTDDYALYAIGPDGEERWHFLTEAPIRSSPAIDGAGVIYVGSDDGHLYAINPDGTLKWRFPTGGPVLSSPAIGPDGTIYVGSNDHHLYAIGAHRGVAIFQFRNLLVSPREVIPGEEVLVQAEVHNLGDASGTVIAELLIDGEVRDREEITLGPGEATLVSFTISFTAEELGTHWVTIDGLPPVEVEVVAPEG